METLKFFCLLALAVLLLKNLNVIQWHGGRPSIDFEGTRKGLVDTIKGEGDDSGKVSPAAAAE
ncbi:MAG: hypothetical protein F6K19_33440 [Cyanothece sp. SIO1E1]|nr:hypothetical protein [Cyanothece sp. SIO1E1]